MLPGAKVNEEIARIRGIKVGENAFSPNRHQWDGLLLTLTNRRLSARMADAK